MADSTKVRLVRCPNCQTILPVLVDYSLYKCGACGSVLSAKRNDHGSASLLEKKDDETDHHYKSGNFSERISKRRAQQEHESQVVQEGSNKREKKWECLGESHWMIYKDTAETSSSKEIGHEKGVETEFLKILLESLPSDKTNILKQLKVTPSKLGDQSEASIKEGKDTQSSMPKVDIPVAKTDSFSQGRKPN
ncbi:hypothetical protein PIB30_010143 [Stylosanthes scabra]|uniref:Enhanced disease resistance 4-like N-terminal domain-containing protein n=1 Tax=Stylosanthes scabra TaxID=79078 RepID=A0ABU6Z5Y0_9FABA|nr:hypothetical protein [Stylosanthes scabra]